MGAIERVFRGRRGGQERPAAAIVAGLWKNGEQGVWYDPSDLSTMYQDAAGTIPVYAPGSGQVDPPVGRMLDKSGRGNHATQATTTSRPTLSARYNLLIGTDALSTQTVATAATSYLLKISGTGSVTLAGSASGSYFAGTYSITCTAGTLTLTVSGSVTQADLRAANDCVGLPAYQRVVNANTYDVIGFPLYLTFDGVDDFLQTANINFTGTASVIAASAIRKLSDAAFAIVYELSPGPSLYSFALAAPLSAAAGNVYWSSRGSIGLNVTSSASYVSPRSVVAVGIGGIGDKKCILRINGIVEGQNTSSQGSGNYGEYPLYIGRRGGTSLPFAGRLYGLIIRGAATPDSTLAKVERYLNMKAKVY